MEFFRNVNVDWMGKAKYFVALSLILLAVGWISILRNGGLRYGIDFRGGTLVYVRFSGPAPVNQIRKGLQDCRPGQQFHSNHQRQRVKRQFAERCGDRHREEGRRRRSARRQ